MISDTLFAKYSSSRRSTRRSVIRSESKSPLPVGDCLKLNRGNRECTIKIESEIGRNSVKSILTAKNNDFEPIES